MIRIARILSILALTFVCTGCWDVREVERVAIVTAAGLDVSQAGSPGAKVLYTAQIAKPSALGGPSHMSPGGSIKSFTVEQAVGDDISEAQDEIQRKLPRQLFLSHRRIVIFGEDLAKSGVAAAVDELIRNPESRLRTYVLVAHGSPAGELLKKTYSLARLPSDALWEMERSGMVVKVDVKEFAAALLEEGQEPFTMGIEPTENAEGQSTDTFRLNDVAVFKGDKLVGWLNRSQSNGFMWIRGLLRTTVSTVQIPGVSGRVSCKLSHAHTVVRPVMVNGKPMMDVDIRVEDDVFQNGTVLNLHTSRNVLLLERVVEKKIEQDAQAAIDVLQHRYHTDILGFGAKLHQRDPRFWKTVKGDWNTYFSDLPVQIHTHATVLRSGFVGPSLAGGTKHE